MFYYYTIGAIFLIFVTFIYPTEQDRNPLAKMKYKVKQSGTDRYVVYRKFHYKPKLSLGTKGFLSVTLLSIGIYLSIPTHEDIVILGAIGKYLSSIFGLTNGRGVMYATLTYKGTGIALICIAAVLGGSYIRDRLMTQVKNHVKYINQKLQI